MASRGFRLLFRINWALFKDMTVVSTFREVLKRNPDKVMYINCTDNTEWTYQQVSRRAHFYDFVTVYVFRAVVVNARRSCHVHVHILI
jgi:hypothetical protein